MSAIGQPIFESLTLDALAAAFHRRGKAMRYQGEYSVGREIDAGDERLNIDFFDCFKHQLCFSVWSNGDWRFRACQPKPGRTGGWLFKHELRGQLDKRAADAWVKSFEDSMLASHWSPDEQLAKLQELWHVERPPAEA